MWPVKQQFNCLFYYTYKLTAQVSHQSHLSKRIYKSPEALLSILFTSPNNSISQKNYSIFLNTVHILKKKLKLTPGLPPAVLHRYRTFFWINLYFHAEWLITRKKGNVMGIKCFYSLCMSPNCCKTFAAGLLKTPGSQQMSLSSQEVWKLPFPFGCIHNPSCKLPSRGRYRLFILQTYHRCVA